MKTENCNRGEIWNWSERINLIKWKLKKEEGETTDDWSN